MAKKATLKELRDAIRKQNLRVTHLQYAVDDALYFETMPEYDPMYKYCYSTSNMKIPSVNQSVDSWLRAVNKHMKLRREGHGGGVSSAMIVSVPLLQSERMKEIWLAYQMDKLRKAAKVTKKKSAT